MLIKPHFSNNVAQEPEECDRRSDVEEQADSSVLIAAAFSSLPCPVQSPAKTNALSQHNPHSRGLRIVTQSPFELSLGNLGNLLTVDDHASIRGDDIGICGFLRGN